MTKAEANNRLKLIYRALRDNNKRTRLNSKISGWGQITPRFVLKKEYSDFFYDIEINPHKSSKSFMKAVLHECIHLAYQNKIEDEIQKIEQDMFPLLTDRQLTNLLTRCIL